MVKRLFLLSLLVLALCGASTMSFAGGPGGGSAYMPPPPGLPPVCGPAATNYSQVTEVITPVPAQLRKVRVVAPYLAGVAWPRTRIRAPGPRRSFGRHRGGAACGRPGAPGARTRQGPAAHARGQARRRRSIGCGYRRGALRTRRSRRHPLPPSPRDARDRPLAAVPEFAWFVLFNDGYVQAGGKGFNSAVRAVRAGL